MIPLTGDRTRQASFKLESDQRVCESGKLSAYHMLGISAEQLIGNRHVDGYPQCLRCRRRSTPSEKILPNAKSDDGSGSFRRLD